MLCSSRPWASGLICFVLSLSILSSACKTDDPSDVKRVPYQEQAPTGGQTRTEARVISLNNWARQLLSETKDGDDFQRLADDYFAKIGIKDAEPLSTYTLSLRPGNECFHEGKAVADLWWEKGRDQVRRQLESAAQFILEYHKATLGRPAGPFGIREVEICPKTIVGREMNYIGQKLIIGVPYAPVKGYEPITSDKLIERWRRGDHLVEEKKAFTNIFTRNKLTKIWMVFDPIGTLRNNLRQMLAGNGQSLARRIDTLGPSPDLNSVKSGVLTVADPKRIRIANDANLKQLADAQKLPLFIENWRCLARSLRLADDLSLGAVSALDQAIRQDQNKVNVEIKAGLVAVGNYHQIGVSFGASNSPFGEYIDRPTPQGNNNEINVKVSSGLVSVFTIDDVKVDVAINLINTMAQKSLETASLDGAAQAALADRKLCL